MIFTETGKLTDFFYIIGNRYFPTHLLLGSKPVLFEAGISCLGPLYVKEVQEILGKNQPQVIFLTHMHFDHCGAAGLLKQTWPELKVAASQSAAEIIGRPNAVNTIAKLNESTIDWIENESPGLASTMPFQPFNVDLILEEGDFLEISNGLTVQVLSTPGHTWDSLSFYIPEKKMLVAGEAVGCMSPMGVIFTEFLVDFDAYIHSMERLAMLDVDILCQSHHQVFTGIEAQTFCQRSIEAAYQFRKRLEVLLDEENGHVEKVAERIKSEEYDPHPGPKQPEQAYLLNIQAKVKHLAQKMAQ
ncbi:MBL fold metallo-hydrolase [Desulfobacula sp.]|uniref:MBL fold metallo-hydrolase n=1 Tax=Desulfobacula sp. TaxID=2593537 RepID=UPI002636EDFC|nr:MBL fold metallo-hydrolase [Desulfobacula sp.]